MTQYHGGKKRIGRLIADRIYQTCELLAEDIQIRGYVEPFSGMLGVFQHVHSDACESRCKRNHSHVFPYRMKWIASDFNRSVVQMWKAVRNGWTPPTQFSSRKYYALQADGTSSALKGFVGHACSFRGIYFASYNPNCVVGYASQQVSSLMETLLRGPPIDFQHADYSKYSSLRGYVIYCDPPYYKSSRYSYEDGTPVRFDHEKFYKWAEKMAEHNLVFISENSKLPYTMIGKWKDERLYLV